MLKTHDTFITGFIIILTALSSCVSKPAEYDVNQVYFDIPGYFESEITRLEVAGYALDKMILYKGQTEEKRIQSPDWKTELELFVSFNINNASNRGMYQTDSVRIAGTDSIIISYKAINEESNIRDVLIKEDLQGNVLEFSLTENKSNLLYSSTRKLNYRSDISYRIETNQQTLLLKDYHYVIRGSITH